MAWMRALFLVLVLSHSCLFGATALPQSQGKPTVLFAVGRRSDALKVSSTIKWLKNYYMRYLRLLLLFSGEEPVDELLSAINVMGVTADFNLQLTNHTTGNPALFLTEAVNASMVIFQNDPPSAVIVRGDTATAIAVAMAAFYCKIRVIHIDAGFRSQDLSYPHPEEFNRRVISLIATMSLSPTQETKQNLIADGVDQDTIFITGSTIVDAVAESIKPLNEAEKAQLDAIMSVLLQPGSSKKKKKYVIFSLHNRQTGDSIRPIIDCVREISSAYTDFVFYIFLSPVVASRDMVAEMLYGTANSVVLDMIAHYPFLQLLQNSTAIISDSANIQEEATVFAVPCIVLRESTERVESIQAGLSQVVHPGHRGLVHVLATRLNSVRARTARPALQEYIGIYGDGFAGVRCACNIAKHVGISEKSLEYMACGKDSQGGQEYMFQDTKPLLDRNVIRDSGEEEERAVRIMKDLDLATHPSRLFRPYFEPDRISVIVTQYKRNTTEIQLRALFSQTVFSKIDKVVIFQNEDYINLDFLTKIDFSEEIIEEITPQNRKYLSQNRKKSFNHMNDIIEIVQSRHHNYKYHGRFALALLFDTEYTFILDDDTIPQPKWLEVSVDLSRKRNAIVGPVGVIVGPDRQYYLNPPLDFTVEVDYTGHSWTFKTEWLKYLWGAYVPTWEAGEDIGFSALAWIHGRIRTVMPKMSLNEYEMWGDSVIRFHHDGNESHTIPVHRFIRWPITRYWLSQGWIPCLLRDFETLCAGEEICKRMYEHFNKEGNISAERLHLKIKGNPRAKRQRLLSEYITLGSNANVVWFEDENRPKTIQEENRLKQLSSFEPYKTQKESRAINSYSAAQVRFTNPEDDSKKDKKEATSRKKKPRQTKKKSKRKRIDL